MTARFSFQSNVSDLPAIQAAVKRHNMSFVSNPAAWVGKLARMSVTVEADDMADFNAGVEAIRDIIDPPWLKPAKVSLWSRMLGR